jgi:hypothetical protein
MTTREKTEMTPSSETAILIFNFENTPQPTTGAIPLGGMFPEGKTKKTKEIKEMEKKPDKLLYGRPGPCPCSSVRGLARVHR